MKYFRKKLKRKGSLFDGFFAVFFLFTLAITVIIGFTVLSEFRENIQTNPSLSDVFSNESQQVLDTQTDKFKNYWDGLFLFVLLGLFVSAIISSLFIDTHPAFFFISILGLIMLVAFTAIMANVFLEFAGSDKLLPTASQFTIIPFVMDNLIIIVLIMTISILVALYGKTRT